MDGRKFNPQRICFPLAQIPSEVIHHATNGVSPQFSKGSSKVVWH